MKKTLSLILAAAMIVTLFAGFGSRPAAADDAEYTIMFASTSPEGSAKNEKIELVLKQKLEEKSGGRLTMDIYSSNTLAGSGEMLDALTNGIANMGWFLCPVYQGNEGMGRKVLFSVHSDFSSCVFPAGLPCDRPVRKAGSHYGIRAVRRQHLCSDHVPASESYRSPGD